MTKQNSFSIDPKSKPTRRMNPNHSPGFLFWQNKKNAKADKKAYFQRVNAAAWESIKVEGILIICISIIMLAICQI